MKTARILGVRPATAGIVGMTLCAALLAGCGQKGPLYLPPAAAAQPAVAPTPAVTATTPATLSATR